MNKSSYNSNREEADFFLDITNEVCPMTFVRTKLLIETMKQGDVAEIRLQGAEPLENVPRSAKKMGNIVISLIPEDDASSIYGIHRLLFRKV